MRVLLTGAAGFVGSRARVALESAGHDVVAVDVMLPAAHGGSARLPDDTHRVDVRDSAALAPLLDGIDVVCHQAAVVGAGLQGDVGGRTPDVTARRGGVAQCHHLRMRAACPLRVPLPEDGAVADHRDPPGPIARTRSGPTPAGTGTDTRRGPSGTRLRAVMRPSDSTSMRRVPGPRRTEIRP